MNSVIIVSLSLIHSVMECHTNTDKLLVLYLCVLALMAKFRACCLHKYETPFYCVMGKGYIYTGVTETKKRTQGKTKQWKNKPTHKKGK